MQKCQNINLQQKKGLSVDNGQKLLLKSSRQRKQNLHEKMVNLEGGLGKQKDITGKKFRKLTAIKFIKRTFTSGGHSKFLKIAQ